MSRYIEYHDICSAIGNQQDGTGMTYEALAHAMVEIQLAPSIDIVRCKECRWRKQDKSCDLNCRVDYLDGTEIDMWFYTEDDDFCSYGERSSE